MFLKTSEKTVEKLKKTLFVSEKTEKKLKKLLHFLFFDSFFACFSKHFRVVSISSETTVTTTFEFAIRTRKILKNLSRASRAKFFLYSLIGA